MVFARDVGEDHFELEFTPAIFLDLEGWFSDGYWQLVLRRGYQLQICEDIAVDVDATGALKTDFVSL
jgi:hypothetical protein